MRSVPPKPAQLKGLDDVASEIERLARLPTGELKTAWAAEFRRDPPKGLWRDMLLRTLAWRLQERVLGGHDKATLKSLEEWGRSRAGNLRYPRLKPGTVLVREFSGIRHTVTITLDGFVWQEKSYPSLTAIARIISGTNWNGPRFFGLREGVGTKHAQRQEEATT